MSGCHDIAPVGSTDIHLFTGVVIQIRAFPSANDALPNVIFSCIVGDDAATGPGNWIFAQGKARVVQTMGNSSYLAGRM